MHSEAIPESHVVIVTGAGGGLGGAMARGLLAAGRRVVGVDIERGAAGLAALIEHARAQEASDRLCTITSDIRSPEEAEHIAATTIERFGEVHALVNNAGLAEYEGPDGKRVRFLDVPPEYWRLVIDTNLNGPFMMAQAVGRRLVEQGWGRIVNVTTALTTMVMANMSPYGPAKAGLEAATAIWAKDLADTGVTVNVLYPGGPADTPMLRAEWRRLYDSILPPTVMVAPVVWLTSHAADGVTGARFAAKRWDPNAPVEANLRNATAPAALVSA